MSLYSDLEIKTKEANERLASEGISLCWGGDFSRDGNIFQRGIGNLLNGRPVVFPICLNNGYYSESQIENLTRGIAQFDNPVCVFLTDGPAKYNYMALDIAREKALRKTRLHGQGLLNRFRRGLHSMGGDAEKRFFVFSWEDIYRHPVWLNENQFLHRLFESNGNFRTDVEVTTRQVLASRKKLFFKVAQDEPVELSADEIDKAKNYTLEELAFVNVSHKLLGVDAICYLYKEGWKVFEKLADGHYTGTENSGVGFLAFHVLPQLCETETPVVVSTEQLGELSSHPLAEKRHRPDAPLAPLNRIVLSNKYLSDAAAPIGNRVG